MPSAGSSSPTSELLRAGGAAASEARGFLSQRLDCLRAALLQLAQVEVGAVHQIELGARFAPGPDDVRQRGTVLLGQAKDEVATALHFLESCGVELHRCRVLVELARELLEGVIRSVEELLHPGERGVHALRRDQGLPSLREVREHRFLATVEERGDAGHQRAELVGVLQATRFLVERDILALAELRVFHLRHDVAQIIGAALGLRAPASERIDLARDRAQLFPARANALGVVARFGESVEYPALRLGIEERLGLSLAVQVHRHTTDLGEHASSGAAAVDPGAGAARGSDLAPEHDRPLVHVDPAFIE